jgi:hypothetical protein
LFENFHRKHFLALESNRSYFLSIVYIISPELLCCTISNKPFPLGRSTKEKEEESKAERKRSHQLNGPTLQHYHYSSYKPLLKFTGTNVTAEKKQSHKEHQTALYNNNKNLISQYSPSSEILAYLATIKR